MICGEALYERGSGVATAEPAECRAERETSPTSGSIRKPNWERPKKIGRVGVAVIKASLSRGSSCGFVRGDFKEKTQLYVVCTELFAYRCLHEHVYSSLTPKVIIKAPRLSH